MSKEITIAGKLFSVTQPYAAGHALTEGEAKALNQVRCENIRNNMATAVKKGVEEKKSDAEIAELVAKYDAEYVFAVSGAGAPRVTDPFERECISLARAELTRRIKEKGGKVADMDKDALNAKIAEWAAHPKIKEAAKKSLALKASVTAGLGDLGEPEAATEAA